jgi:TorA-specific chaperone
MSQTLNSAAKPPTADSGCMDILPVIETRVSAYQFLASAYRQEPTMEFLSLLAHEMPTSEGILGDFVTSLAQASEDTLADIKTNLVAEYARLFLAMSAKPVPPYESVYTSQKGLLKQEAWQQVVSEYAEAGFSRDEEFVLPEDHIALELEFMAILGKQCAKEFTAGNKDGASRLLKRQHAFLKQHLLNWVPRFCNDVLATTTSAYYKGIAQTTREVIAQDDELLAELICCPQVFGQAEEAQ